VQNIHLIFNAEYGLQPEGWPHRWRNPAPCGELIAGKGAGFRPVHMIRQISEGL